MKLENILYPKINETKIRDNIIPNKRQPAIITIIASRA
jgi:hypothetical protein